MDEKKLISVIVPCYNEQEVLPMFFKEIRKVSAQMQEKFPETEFEFLFIDDGSKDSTLSILRAMKREDSRVRYISFSRNFGKESGIYAGLSNAKGDYCVVMDADLQHPPKFLPTMYEAVRSGRYDCATTRRVSREGESKIRSWFARLFYRIMNKISQTEIVDGAQDFRFMTRQMVDAVLSMCEYNRFSKGIFSWVGFRVKYLEYENVERAAGTSAWSFWGLFRYSLEGILGFSTAPLTATAIIGFVSCLLGLILLLFTVIKKLVVGGDPLGYATTTCCIIFFGGLQVFCTGILGLYLGKTYLEVKHRPVYLVRETDENAEQFEQADEADPEELEKRLKMNAVRRLKLETETEQELDEIVSAAFAEDEPEKAIAAEPERAAAEDGSGDWEEPLPYDDEADDGEPEYADDEADDGEPEYADDEADDSEPEYADDEADDGEPEYADDEADDGEPEYADDEADDGEPEYADDEADDGEPEYADDEADDGEPEYADDEADDGELESADDEAENSEPESAEEDAEDEDAAAAELEAALKAAPRAPKRTEKFEIKIDYDSIDFDEDDDYEEGGKPAPRAAKRPVQTAPAPRKKPAARPAAHYEDEEPQGSFKEKALDIWYAVRDKMRTLKDKISEKINQAANGRFDPDAIERELDPEAFDEDDADDYDDYDGDGYDDYPEDDGYDDDLDPEYDEHADDDDYHGSHF